MRHVPRQDSAPYLLHVGQLLRGEAASLRHLPLRGLRLLLGVGLRGGGAVQQLLLVQQLGAQGLVVLHLRLQPPLHRGEPIKEDVVVVTPETNNNITN
jgi:hypothetical protein